MTKHPFEYQRPTDLQVGRISQIREACKRLHDDLLELPQSRCRSLAITKLEECSMWANKAIVFEEETA